MVGRQRSDGGPTCPRSDSISMSFARRTKPPSCLPAVMVSWFVLDHDRCTVDTVDIETTHGTCTQTKQAGNHTCTCIAEYKCTENTVDVDWRLTNTIPTGIRPYAKLPCAMVPCYCCLPSCCCFCILHAAVLRVAIAPCSMQGNCACASNCM